MSVLPKHPLPDPRLGAFGAPEPQGRQPARSLGLQLLAQGLVTPYAYVQALAGSGRLTDHLLRRRAVDEDQLFGVLAQHHGVGVADLCALPPDPRLIDRFGALNCLRAGLVPWCRQGDITLIAAGDPADFAQHRARLSTAFGPVVLALAPPRRIEAAVLKLRGAKLAREAERRVPADESCRNWNAASSAKLVLACMVLAGATVIWPQILLGVMLGWAALTLIATMSLKAAALWQSRHPAPVEQAPGPIIARLPVVSVIVALYREADLAARLVQRLGRLEYPRGLLDIVLVVEETDHLTRNALARAELPGWMRIVAAPEGRVKTKPRALNFALGLCRGSIVGVYDAEDAPESDQIRRVVERFYRRGPQVACLQGVLDFYNPATNWLSRCFTIEYASWFRVMLPGLQRLGLPIPLGGTTLFFRRDALERLGGWDAHNVTEDADLGIRLARHGYRTELIATTTYEEANCRVRPWIMQRSRWIKGYMMTYATHMRDPVLLWRQLGARQFIGFQILFLGSISQVVLLPVMWSLWALLLGVPHPLTTALPTGALLALSALFITSEILSITLGVVGLRRSGQTISTLWVPTLHVYYPLGALASYKAVWEMMHKPFYWDKTSHGHFDPPD